MDVKSYQKGHQLTTRRISICIFEGAKCLCVMSCATHLREIIELPLHVLFEFTGVVTTLVKQAQRILYLPACPELVMYMLTCAVLNLTLILHPNLKLAAVVAP